MKCGFEEKVSMLIDGELPPAETEEVRQHIESCRNCRELERDFLFFRRQLKEAAQASFEAEIYRQPVFGKSSVRRGVLLPVPVFAGLIVVSALMFGWIVFAYFGQTPPDESAGKRPAIRPAANENPPSEVSLARFDRGGRAEIYVAAEKNRERER